MIKTLILNQQERLECIYIVMKVTQRYNGQRVDEMLSVWTRKEDAELYVKSSQIDVPGITLYTVMRSIDEQALKNQSQEILNQKDLRGICEYSKKHGCQYPQDCFEATDCYRCQYNDQKVAPELNTDCQCERCQER